MRIGQIILVFSLLAFITAGCSQGRPKPEGFPVLVPASITVLQDGSPLERALVNLHPDDGARNWGTLGVTNANGVATLTTASYWRGAPLGTFKITVSKTEIEQSRLVEPPLSDSEAYREWEIANARERLATHSLVDARFGDPSRTPLSVTVTGAFSETVEVGPAVRTEVQQEN